MIEAMRQVTPLTGTSAASGSEANRPATDFKHALSDALREVNAQQIHAEQLKRQLATGEVEHLHEVTVAAERASLSLQLALQVRNKVVEAYNEIMRMQI